MSEKGIVFVEKTCDFVKQNPNLVLPYLDMLAFCADFGNAYGLWKMVYSIRQFDENADDAEMTLEI